MPNDNAKGQNQAISKSDYIIEIKNLYVNFRQHQANGKDIQAVKNVSFGIKEGKTLALVGESGSGKSVTASAILKLLPYPHAYHPETDDDNDDKEQRNQIIYQGTNILTSKDSFLRYVRGNEISMIFQEPMSALNPLHTIGKQLFESLNLHQSISKANANEKIVELLDKVGIANPNQRLNSYPHELSGGQRQRVMIAIAIANNPKVLIADEPTTALDVTTQVKILDLLMDLQKENKMSILLITHDLSIIPRMADDICVMKDGIIVESGSSDNILKSPQHSYTQTLIQSEPEGKPFDYDANQKPILQGLDIRVYFPIKAGFFQRTVDYIKAVDNISLRIKKGQTIGIVGESGSGKTTLAQALLRLIDSQGTLMFHKQSLQVLSSKQLRPIRKHLQFVFQDPFASLNPRMTVGEIILEGLEKHFTDLSKQEQMNALDEVLTDVNLDLDFKGRYPHELSGGQRQRVGIARSLILRPDIIALDEPTSALDRTVQKQVIELLRNLQKKYNLAYLFISHDLLVVKAMSHEIIVLKNGKVVERNSAQNIFYDPQHEYTKTLIAAVT